MQDNGVGFPKVIPKEKGMGLRIMQSRAGTIGGWLSIEKDPAGGTAVLCSVPGGRVSWIRHEEDERKRHKRVLIVDDHPMMRQGLAQLINHEPDLAACGEADTVAQAMKRISADKPDLVLADISLPDAAGWN